MSKLMQLSSLFFVVLFGMQNNAEAVAAFVKISTGEHITVEVNSDETILNLKEKIYSLTNISVENQRIIFGSSQPKDDEMLGNKPVQDSFHLIVRSHLKK